MKIGIQVALKSKHLTDECTFRWLTFHKFSLIKGAIDKRVLSVFDYSAAIKACRWLHMQGRMHRITYHGCEF